MAWKWWDETVKPWLAQADEDLGLLDEIGGFLINPFLGAAMIDQPPELEGLEETPPPTVAEAEQETGVDTSQDLFSPEQLQSFTGEMEQYATPDLSTYLWEGLPMINDPSHPGRGMYTWRQLPNGEYVRQQDFTPGMVMPRLQDTSAFAGMQGLTEEFRGGPTDTDYARAIGMGEEMLAGAMGYEDIGRFRSDQDLERERLLAARQGDYSGFQGLSPEDEANLQEYSRRTAREQEAKAVQALENMTAGEAHAGNLLRMAESQGRNIGNQQVATQQWINQQNYERQLAAADRSAAYYTDMVNRGLMTQNLALTQIMQGKATALQGYAQQLNTITQSNQQYLQNYAADNAALMANANLTYQSWTMATGTNQQLLNQVTQTLENLMTEWHGQMEAVTFENYNKMLEYQMEFTFEDALNYLLKFIGVGGQAAANTGIFGGGETGGMPSSYGSYGTTVASGGVAASPSAVNVGAIPVG
jgi:hypothetical protein